MYKNRTEHGRNNICGTKVSEYRMKLPEKTSQRKLAELLQIAGLDIDKNAVQRIDAGKRFVTDIELRALAEVFSVTVDELISE